MKELFILVIITSFQQHPTQYIVGVEYQSYVECARAGTRHLRNEPNYIIKRKTTFKCLTKPDFEEWFPDREASVENRE